MDKSGLVGLGRKLKKKWLFKGYAFERKDYFRAGTSAED